MKSNKRFAERFLQHYKTEEANRRRGQLWIDGVDLPIIEACAKRPGHKNVYEVYGKVALVNRMYAAMLGRYTKVGDPEWKVAEQLVKHDADSFIAPLASFRKLDTDAVPEVVASHRKLVKIIYRLTKKEFHSFSAKYLSFHFPRLVPISDSKAITWSKRIVADLGGRKAVAADSEYEKHCRRILILLDFLRSNQIEDPDIKLVDLVLYWDMT
jgi:hypothetical protein